MNITSLYKALNYGTVTTLYKRRHAQTILNEIGRGGARNQTRGWTVSLRCSQQNGWGRRPIRTRNSLACQYCCAVPFGFSNFQHNNKISFHILPLLGEEEKNGQWRVGETKDHSLNPVSCCDLANKKWPQATSNTVPDLTFDFNVTRRNFPHEYS